MTDRQPLLRGIFFLRHLDDAALDRVAQSLVAEEYAPGHTIARGNSPCGGLYFILSGSIERQPHPNGHDLSSQTLNAGDTFGALELVRGHPWTAAYTALEPTKVYLWKKREAAAFFQKHPTAMADLRFAARSQALAQTLRFTWLSENELVDGLTRKHPALLVRVLAVPALLILGAAALVWWGSNAVGDPLIWLASGVAAVGLLYGIWQYNRLGERFLPGHQSSCCAP